MIPKTPIVGITADIAKEQPRINSEPILLLARRYCRAVELADAIPIILPPLALARSIRQSIKLLDGLIISGGGFDIHPSYYGEHPLHQLGTVKAQRTEFELEIAAAALKQDLPILGICGGEQALNVANLAQR